MKVSEIKEIPKEFIDSLLNYGIKELNEPQKLSIKKGLLKGNNIIISSPTASGKTLIAELAIIKNFIEKKGKAIYIVPLRSLASEKYNDFKKKYSKHGIKIAISIGDLDSSDPWLAKYDLIIVTSEKMDSLIRHGVSWINEISLVVIDEIHLLNDINRGPTLEVLATRLRQIVPHTQLLGLSATIKNSDEIARWLDAELVKSKYRPIKLYEGIYHNGEIYFKGKEKEKAEGKRKVPELLLIEDTLSRNKQALVFLSTRRNAESVAEKSCEITNKFLTKRQKEILKDISNKILNVLEIPTHQCKKISELVKNGCAFHHSGLLSKQKTQIEDCFRRGLIKVICCTPTLAMGLNLPAFRCIIRDLKRYSAPFGSRWIPVLEWKQYVGRGGRPGLDEFGEGIAIAKSEGEKERIEERYIYGEPEEITSKLGVEPVLRMHILSLISQLVARDKKQLLNFFEKTFYAHQYKFLSDIEDKISTIIDKFKKYGFIKEVNKKFIPTLIGKRISELYIDPETGWHLINCLKTRKKTKEISYLQMICNTLEMHPLLRVSARQFPIIHEKLAGHEAYLLQGTPNAWDYEYEKFISSYRTGLLLLDWINEKSHEYLFQEHNIAPGNMRIKMLNSDWLLYSSSEIARIIGRKEILKDINKLRLRVKYGVKEELISLLRFKGIGRVRARRLYRNKIKNVKDIKKASIIKLAKILGSKIAQDLKKQVSV